MDLTRIDKLLIGDETGGTMTGNVATNTAKGEIDVVGGDCPKGQEWCPMKKECVPVGRDK